jgi:hypothetical protein
MSTVVTNKHLRGVAVTVLGDGVIKPSGVVDVDTGTLTIADTVSDYSIGIPFTRRIVTLTPEIGSPSGSAHGNSMRINEITVRILETLGLVINGQEVEFRRLGRDKLDTPLVPVSGEYRMENLGWERGEAQIEITHALPHPFHVLSVIKKITVND